jgi:hypothetical protein
MPHGGGNLADLAPDLGGVSICRSVDGLADVRKPGTELVIWRRTLSADLPRWLGQLAVISLPDLRMLLRPDNLSDALEQELDECGMTGGEMRAALVADVVALARCFAHITRSNLVDVRLERVSNDACWRFHRDCVEARLLTTYLGPGTEWVPPAHAEKALQQQKQYRGPLEHLEHHDVAIFKGSCAGSGSGIVHRSPPITGTGQTRLLLCINQRSATSPPLWSAYRRRHP